MSVGVLGASFKLFLIIQNRIVSINVCCLVLPLCYLRYGMATAVHADAVTSSSFKLAIFLFLICYFFDFIGKTCITYKRNTAICTFRAFNQTNQTTWGRRGRGSKEGRHLAQLGLKAIRDCCVHVLTETCRHHKILDKAVAIDMQNRVSN